MYSQSYYVEELADSIETKSQTLGRPISRAEAIAQAERIISERGIPTSTGGLAAYAAQGAAEINQANAGNPYAPLLPRFEGLLPWWAPFAAAFFMFTPKGREILEWALDRPVTKVIVQESMQTIRQYVTSMAQGSAASPMLALTNAVSYAAIMNRLGIIDDFTIRLIMGSIAVREGTSLVSNAVSIITAVIPFTQRNVEQSVTSFNYDMGDHVTEKYTKTFKGRE